jgi:hypothetical protein
MADSAKEKRLALNDYKAARHSLARILRMRFRGEIDSATFRDMVSGLHCLLGFDKLQKETELEKRLGELENKRGQFVINITPEEAIGLDDPDWQEARIRELEEKERHLTDEEERVQKARFFLEGLPYAVVQSSLPCEEAPMPEVSPAPDPVPAIQELPEQPQPRRLKL